MGHSETPMSRYDNLLAGKNQAIRVLWCAFLFAAGLAIFNGVGWMRAPEKIRIHVPPDLSSGAVLRPGAPGKGDVYTFAYYIWQQLYRWERNGAKDYKANIHALQHYLTPECFQDRLDDYDARNRVQELARRARTVTEIPGRGFSNKRVVVRARGAAWRVYMDLHITETMLGEPVKTRLVNYPIRVVSYEVDPERNPFGLAIDCLADKPRAIEVAAARGEQ